MRRRAAAPGAVLAAALLMTAWTASAQSLPEGLRAVLDVNSSAVTTRTTTASGSVTTTDTTNFYPRLTLNLETLVSPTFRLTGGGVFEINSSSGRSGDTDIDTALTNLRPFVELRSTNALFAPGVGYYRRTNRMRSGGRTVLDLVNEDYAAYLTWNPEGLPRTSAQFVRTRTFDTNRTSQDGTRDLGSILSRYAFRDVNLYYQGTYLDTTDRVHGFESRQVSNGGRVEHSRSAFSNRLTWNATYYVNRQSLTTTARGEEGQVEFPVSAFAGLSSLNDTPVNGTLPQNPALVDGNLTAGAGINIGLSAPGLDSQARNIGLDLASLVEVNRLLVWVDRELPPNIASTFSWDVYSSTDNLFWKRETTVSAAPFGPFENRFQLDFRGVVARYLKVVTRPLSPAVIDAGRYPDILVTELQAILTRRAGEARGRQTRTMQNLNTDLRLRLLDAPMLYYEGSYWYNSVGIDGLERDTLSNGVSLTHRFNRLVGTYARAAIERGIQPEGRRNATVTNATLTLDPLPTLRTALLYTGQDEEIGGRPNDRQGFTVQTNAQVYRGVETQVGFGWNVTTRETGERLRDRLLNASATIAPRPDLTLSFTYSDTATTLTNAFGGLERYDTRSGYLTLAVDPFRTLHLVLGEEVVVMRNTKTRLTHNIGANWAPFPDGTLQLIVAYNEARRDLYFGTERTFRAGARWAFSRQSYIDLSYHRLESEFVSLSSDSRIYSADLKIFF